MSFASTIKRGKIIRLGKNGKPSFVCTKRRRERRFFSPPKRNAKLYADFVKLLANFTIYALDSLKIKDKAESKVMAGPPPTILLMFSIFSIVVQPLT